MVTVEAMTPPYRDTFCRHAAPRAWPESERMREIRQKGIPSHIHLFMKVEFDAGETRTRKTLAGKSSRVPMRKFKKSPSVSSCQERVMMLTRLCLRMFKPTCQERASPYMMKAVVNQLKYLQRILTKKQNKRFSEIEKTFDRMAKGK